MAYSVFFIHGQQRCNLIIQSVYGQFYKVQQPFLEKVSKPTFAPA